MKSIAAIALAIVVLLASVSCNRNADAQEPKTVTMGDLVVPVSVSEPTDSEENLRINGSLKTEPVELWKGDRVIGTKEYEDCYCFKTADGSVFGAQMIIEQEYADEGAPSQVTLNCRWILPAGIASVALPSLSGATPTQLWVDLRLSSEDYRNVLRVINGSSHPTEEEPLKLNHDTL